MVSKDLQMMEMKLTAHIESNYRCFAIKRRPRVPDHATRWTTENTLQPTKGFVRYKTAITLHEFASQVVQIATFKAAGEPLNILRCFWREICIGRR